MKEFSDRDKKYILENHDSKSLGEIAQKLKCDWHEVYDCYSEILKSEIYKKKTDAIRNRCNFLRRKNYDS